MGDDVIEGLAVVDVMVKAGIEGLALVDVVVETGIETLVVAEFVGEAEGITYIDTDQE